MVDYILKTLQKENYVFIERLGSFRLRLKHAEITKDTVYPPYNEVVFSPNDCEENNFSLANLISRDKQCLFTEANEQITAWVEELLRALQHNKSVTYEGFGTFMLDKKGNLSFENEMIPQLNSLFEGMEPIALTQPIAAAVEEEVSENDVVTEKVEEPVMETVGANNNSPDNDSHVEPEPVVETVGANNNSPDNDSPVEPEPVVETVGANNNSPDNDLPVEPEPVAEIVGANNNSPDNDLPVEPEPGVETDGANNNSPDNDLPVDVDDDDDDEDEDDEEEEDEDEDEEENGKKHHRLAWLWILLLLLAALSALGFVFRDRLTSFYHQWKDKKQPVEQVVTPDSPLDETAAETEAELVAEEPETIEEPVPEVYTPAVLKQTADGKYNYIQFESGHYYAIAGSFPGEADVERHIRQKNLDQYSPVIVKQDGVKNLRVCIGVFDSEEEAEQFAKGVNPTYWVLK